MMQVLMDQFNDMVKSLPAQAAFAHVRYIDLRGTLSNRLADYQDWWANELHPRKRIRGRDRSFCGRAGQVAVVLQRKRVTAKTFRVKGKYLRLVFVISKATIG